MLSVSFLGCLFNNLAGSALKMLESMAIVVA